MEAKLNLNAMYGKFGNFKIKYLCFCLLSRHETLHISIEQCPLSDELVFRTVLWNLENNDVTPYHFTVVIRELFTLIEIIFRIYLWVKMQCCRLMLVQEKCSMSGGIWRVTPTSFPSFSASFKAYQFSSKRRKFRLLCMCRVSLYRPIKTLRYQNTDSYMSVVDASVLKQCGSIDYKIDLDWKKVYL